MDKERLDLLLKKMGSYSLSEDELAELKSYYANVDDNVGKNIGDGYTEGDTNTNIKRSLEYYNLGKEKFMAELKKDEQMATYLKDMSRADRASALGNMLVRAVDIGTGMSQRKQADESLAQQIAPKRPAVARRSRSLQDLANQARLKAAAPLSATEIKAVQGQVQDAYMADRAQSREAAGGQASRLSSLGQAAINRRYRALRGLQPYYSQVSNQAYRNAADLTQAQIREDQAIREQQRGYYNTDLDNYLRAQQAAGALGSAGRTNVRRGLGGIARAIPELIRSRQYMVDMPTKRGATAPPSATGGSSKVPTNVLDDVMDYQDKIDMQLRGNFDDPFNSLNQSYLA